MNKYQGRIDKIIKSTWFRMLEIWIYKLLLLQPRYVIGEKGAKQILKSASTVVDEDSSAL
jgi:hypothetical protein